MNLYATLNEVVGALKLVLATGEDAVLLALIESASREIDGRCKRHFYTVSETRYFGGWCPSPGGESFALLDDLLVATTVQADSELDGTHAGETWVAGQDFYLWPRERFPKSRLCEHRDGRYSLKKHADYLKITGVWGYGDGRQEDPWSAVVGLTATVATAGGTTLTLSVSAGISAGTTIRLGTEQLYVSAVSGTSATVVRGVNGTVAAAHTAVAVERAAYPAQVRRAVEVLVSDAWGRMDVQGVQMKAIGSFRVAFFEGGVTEKQVKRMVGPLVKSW